VLAVLAVVAADVLRWERVAASADNLWFQRGFRNKVHQVVLENIRDLSVEETEVGGFTLRHGMHNRLARLQVRMKDRRVIALPKTDADSGLDAVEAVANHLRMRLQQLRDRERARRAARSAESVPADPEAAQDEDLQHALARLRRKAASKHFAQ
jgi:hypothetical protein